VKLFSPAASADILATLKRCQDALGVRRKLGGVTIANKTGSLDALRSEVALVYSKAGKIAIAITVDNIPKPDWSPDNPGSLIIADLAQMLAGLKYACLLAQCHLVPADGRQELRISYIIPHEAPHPDSGPQPVSDRPIPSPAGRGGRGNRTFEFGTPYNNSCEVKPDRTVTFRMRAGDATGREGRRRLRPGRTANDHGRRRRVEHHAWPTQPGHLQLHVSASTAFPCSTR